jgi:hypothetical protein
MSTEDEYGHLDQLRADLQALVDAGLVDEMQAPGEPSRYGLSPVGALFAAAIKSEHDQSAMPADEDHAFWPVGPEPCPVCGATDGFDGVAECLRCRVLSSVGSSAL